MNPIRRSCMTLLAGVALALLGVKSCSMYYNMKQKAAPVTERREANERRIQSAFGQSIGMKILKDYGSPERTAQDDLTDMAHALSNFALLVKGDTPVPLGANEEVANALKGKNRAQLRFLPDDAPCFNAEGQIIDRWGSPLFFHARDQSHIDIRSAGPDKNMWNADDVHRTFDGRFLTGDALNPKSLIESTSKK